MRCLFIRAARIRTTAALVRNETARNALVRNETARNALVRNETARNALVRNETAWGVALAAVAAIGRVVTSRWVTTSGRVAARVIADLSTVGAAGCCGYAENECAGDGNAFHFFSW